MTVNVCPTEREGLVSIVVPVYNVEKFIGEALDSLVAQSYRDIEVLLMDDGSTDSSGAICKCYAERDSRFRYIYQENSGAAAARNHGMDLACGEFIMFLDSDDLFEPELVEALHDAIEQDDADVAVCRADTFNAVYESAGALPFGSHIAGGTYTARGFGSLFFQSVTSVPWDKMFRLAFVRASGLRYQTLRYSNDNYFVIMALLCAREIVWLEDVLVHYRVGSGGSLRDKMYLSPCCDLEMLKALRAGFEESELADSRALLASFDSFMADNVVCSAMLLASQSEDALKEFLDCLKRMNVPHWKRYLGSTLNPDCAKRAFKYWAVTSIPAEGLVWAVAPLGYNGWRLADKLSVRRTYLRFLIAPLIASLRRAKCSFRDKTRSLL